MKDVEFRRAGTDPDGEALFDLWIEGRLVDRGLPMDEVVRRIGAFEDRTPAQFRTPERREFERRGT